MANLFETKYEDKQRVIDESVIYTAFIVTTINKNGHTEYVLQVQRGDETWQVLKRYNDFVKLHKTLACSQLCPELPKKKFIGNMHPSFIAQRRFELQEYLKTVLMNPILASSLTTKKFIDPEQYMQPFHDLALQNASMCLRGDGQWIIGQSLAPIGWRVRKHYFKVTQKPTNTKHSPGHSTQKHLLTKSSSQSYNKTHGTASPSSSFDKDVKDSPKDDYLLCWTEYGPDKYADEKELPGLMKAIVSIQHPYIYPIEFVATNDAGALIIRRFNKAGTLKDLLCGCAPINPFLTKYGSPKGRSPLPLKDLATYGRQIIEALRYLHAKDVPHGHVHAGNVIVENGNARLLEIENFLLGVPSFYRPFFIQHCRINTLEALDVYAFGHLIHEMALGYPLQESYARQITDCPDSLRSLLESILLRDALKGNLPTLDQLVNHKFFKEYAPKFDAINEEIMNANKPQFKMTQSIKEHLRLHSQKCETRLRDEQRSVKNQKRLVRVQELMTSEEKEKKAKAKKQEQKQAKLRTQNSLQLQNGPPAVTPVMIKSDSVNSIASNAQQKHPMTVLTPPPIPTTSRHDFTIPSSSTESTKTPDAPPPPPPTTSSSPPTNHGDENRSALLESICNFKRGELRKVNSN